MSAPSTYLDPVQQGLIEASRSRALTPQRKRDRTSIARWVSALAYLAVAGGFAAALPTHRGSSLGALALLIVVYAVATRIQFEVGSGVVIPTELAFMPMLFVLPARDVPLAIVAGMVLSQLPEIVRKTATLDSFAVMIGSGWFALGPAALVAALGEPAATAQRWPLLFLLVGVQTISDFGSTAIREWFALGVRPAELIGAMGLVMSVDGVLAPIGFLGAISGTWSTLLMPALLLWLIARFAAERRGAIDSALELSRAYRGTAFLLGDVIAADDAYTGAHSRDVFSLSIAVGERLGLSAVDRRLSELVALLHDVGKIRIPDEVIRKAGPLTRAERALIETHTIEGQQLLLRVGGLLGEVGQLVRSCHEKWDGTGYPDGLAGEEIPLVARIVCCCDAFTAMTTNRRYRKARSIVEAAAELNRCRASHFDPAVVDALLDFLEPELAAGHTSAEATAEDPFGSLRVMLPVGAIDPAAAPLPGVPLGRPAVVELGSSSR